MDTAVIIPARYNSSRFRGKPLADICNRPMIWWVYRQVKKARRIDTVTVAADSEEVREACAKWGMDCVMTSAGCPTSTERVYEASRQIPADVYLCVNGDEPLLDPALVERVIPADTAGFFAANLVAKIHSPVEVVDESNIKAVAGRDGRALFFSRSPIPHPKASLAFDYYKHLGVLAYSPEALRFFAETPKGPVEAVEDVNELRFVENGRPLRLIPVEAHTLSVDTPKDLDYVRGVVQKKLESGELTL